MMSTSSPAAQRLVRLEKFLHQDPANPSLLADACATAIAAGEHGKAMEHVRTAERLALDPPAWTFRRATLCIAQRDLDQAEALLGQLQAAGDHPAVSHDLAYVRFLRGDMAGARSLLEPWLAAWESVDAAQREALQMLWLRVLHGSHALEEAWDWLGKEEAAGRLQARAMGPASLVAIDSSHFDAALRWSEAALAADGSQVEALTARAYVAMARRQPDTATQLLERALRGKPEDGRIWSALGYASLLGLDLPRAESQLQRAVQTVPRHIGTWHALGWARLLQRNIAGALEAFRAALDLDRNFGESHGAIGLVLALAGEREAAERHLELAQKLDPANVTGRYARALLAGDAQDPARLAELARRLLDRPGFLGGKLSDAVTQP